MSSNKGEFESLADRLVRAPTTNKNNNPTHDTNHTNNDNQQLTKRPINWLYATPLIAAPLLPLVRHVLKPYPKARNYVFFGGIAFFFCHGIFLMSSASEARPQ